MTQASLFTEKRTRWGEQRFYGPDVTVADEARLLSLRERVQAFMSDGAWHTLAEIGGALAADVSFDHDSIYAPLHVEAKARAAIPSYVKVAYDQAKAACSTLKTPAVVIRQDRGKPFIFMDLQEFVTFTQALAEVGQGSAIKSLVRDIENACRRIWEAS